MTATSTLLSDLAAELRLASATGEPIAPISARHPELTVANAYAIQGLNAEGRAISGHKIGLTSKAMQEMLGVDVPDYGRIFTEELLDSGAEVAAAELIAPKVEPEIAFVLREGLVGPGVTAAEVLAATDHVLPAIEVIDSRIADWRIGLLDTVADNASCARVVLGTRQTALAPDIDLAAAQVDLRVDGETVQSGIGSAVLGHPAEAVAWLANAVGEFGIALAPGDVIMPGSLTAAVPFTPGARTVADFGPLGKVEVSCR
ncbi:MAG: fumarylacetoacetate hydrolase family protein [Actinobacteria bacterium]|nr:fumarylacetoacetate hydrolase family protein [Actinomycetota bacterium]